MSFASKRDTWIVLLIWGAVVLLVYATLAVAREPHATLAVKLATAAGGLASAGFMLWVMYGTGYRLTADELLIRSGPFRFRVPLDAIDSVTPSRNPLSSPATSLDRLMVRWAGRRRILISPEDKARFLAALVERAPQLGIEGDRAWRRGA